MSITKDNTTGKAADIQAELEETGKAMRELAGMEPERSAQAAADMAKNLELLRSKNKNPREKENKGPKQRSNNDRGPAR